MPKPVIQIKPLTSWSFSRYSDYKRCPAKFKYKHLMGLKEPGSQAMDRGSLIHSLAEKYVKGAIPAKLPPELASFDVELKALRKTFSKWPDWLVVEDTWAFDKAWGPSQWDDWVNCWLRVKLDLAEWLDGETMVVHDWKTGKLRPELQEEYLEQLELYALAAFLRYPELLEVRPELCYLDLGKVYPEKPLAYKRSDVPELLAKWNKRVAPMFKDKLFAPRPNDKCCWCHYRKDNNGPCKY